MSIQPAHDFLSVACQYIGLALDVFPENLDEYDQQLQGLHQDQMPKDEGDIPRG